MAKSSHRPVVIASSAVLVTVFLLGWLHYWGSEKSAFEERDRLLRQERDEIKGQLQYRNEEDSMEGKRFGKLEVKDFQGKRSWPINGDGKRYYVLIVEPVKACGSCLQESIIELARRPKLLSSEKVRILFLTCGDFRRTKMQAHLLGLERNCYYDSSAQCFSVLDIRPINTLSFLVDGSGRIIYACVVDSRHFDAFITFLDKTSRYLQNL